MWDVHFQREAHFKTWILKNTHFKNDTNPERWTFSIGKRACLHELFLLSMNWTIRTAHQKTLGIDGATFRQVHRSARSSLRSICSLTQIPSFADLSWEEKREAGWVLVSKSNGRKGFKTKFEFTQTLMKLIEFQSSVLSSNDLEIILNFAKFQHILCNYLSRNINYISSREHWQQSASSFAEKCTCTFERTTEMM